MAFLIFLILSFIMIFFIVQFIRYRNPYKLIMVFGKKGSGKTTYLTKTCLKYLKKGRPVYSTVPIPGAYYFNPEDIGFYSIPSESVILIDEVGMVWDSRDFKGFKKEYRNYFKLQRHYHHTVYLFSQSFDIDKKLRDLTDSMYLIRSHFNFLSVARRINKCITIVHSDSGTGESHLADDMQFDSLLFFWCGSIQITYIPRWIKYFDSFDIPELPEKEFSYCPVPYYPNLKERLSYGVGNLYTHVLRSVQGLRITKGILRIVQKGR